MTQNGKVLIYFVETGNHPVPKVGYSDHCIGNIRKNANDYGVKSSYWHVPKCSLCVSSVKVSVVADR